MIGPIEFLNRKFFEHNVQSILDTPPLQLGGLPFTALSMVQHRDVLPYLLALKTFAQYSMPNRVIVIADPSLTDSDKALLSQHVPGIIFRDAFEFRHPHLPIGGCWERLAAIASYVSSSYMVQLDADTVTTNPIPEVVEAITSGSAFILGTEDNQHFITCHEASTWSKSHFDNLENTQVAAEASLDLLSIDEIKYYVRGCAGFSGFSLGSFNVESLVAISQRMSALLGQKWSAWGTEQFTSNLIVSNTPNAVILPHPKYCMPSRLQPHTSFLHFIGFQRYTSTLYARTAKDCARTLRKEKKQ